MKSRIALATAALLLLVPPPASAGTYSIDQCATPDGSIPKRVLQDWSAAGETRRYTSCGWSGGSFGLEMPGAGNGITHNSTAWLSLAAPPSLPEIEIERVRLAYRVRPHSGNHAYLELFSAGNRQYSERVPVDRTTAPLDLALPAGARSFDLGIYCSTAPYGPVSCSWDGAFEVFRISSARLTLRESAAPTAAIEGGSLRHAGERAGRETLSYTAGDSASGVERVEARLGSATVGVRDLGQSGACERDGWSACPRSDASTFDVDTTAVPDGTHELTLRVIDAARNERVVSGGAVTVRNRPPEPPPAAPREAAPPTDDPRGAHNGVRASDRARLSAVFERTQASTIHARHGRPVAIVGWLNDEAGRPIEGAALDLSTRVSLPPAQPTPIASLRTDRTGRFRYVLPAGPSRTVRIVYRARELDAAETASAELVTHVAAGVTLRARPTRLRNRRVMALSGRVLGGPIPLRGLVVDLQVRLAGTWRTFAALRSTRTGRFRHRHRFRHVRRATRFRFRARLRRDSRYPYTAGRSRTVAVVVRP